jgi:hypothetical protein
VTLLDTIVTKGQSTMQVQANSLRLKLDPSRHFIGSPSIYLHRAFTQKQKRKKS